MSSNGAGPAHPGPAANQAYPPPSPARDGQNTSPDATVLASLLAHTSHGDEEAFARLYDLTAKYVYGVALRVLRDPGYSEEITQETFLQIWRTAASYDPDRGSPLAWIITLAHRRAVDRVRSAQSEVDREARYGSSAHQIAYDDVLESVTQRLEAEEIAGYLGVLTEAQREALHLAYYHGLTYREVAARLGIGVSTAKTRLRDGLIKLRKCLGVAA